jgi:hypothetical protein
MIDWIIIIISIMGVFLLYLYEQKVDQELKAYQTEPKIGDNYGYTLYCD